MKKLFFGIGFILFIIGFYACNSGPEPIRYGADQCNYCKMNVVDKTHAAQYVTKKGKQFKFDAIECMVHKIRDIGGEQSLGLVLVADYANPGHMIDAHNAFYLISPEIKSPMGANLSAFSDRQVADQQKNIHGGDILTWQKLKTAIK